jgi:AraC-like DNA-binding protein
VRYAEFAPPEAIAPYVHCLWVFEGQDPAEPQRIAPDGRCELILHWRTPYRELTPDGWVSQPRSLFAGQLTRPLHLIAEKPAGVVGVRFRTAGAGAFLQAPVGQLTDQRRALPDGPKLAGARDEDSRLALAASYVAANLDPRTSDGRIAAAAARIRASDGRVPLETLCKEAQLTPRSLQRRFLDEVGVPPRMLASIVRFRRLFEALQAPEVETWTDAAQAAGYFDHPQMSRDFSRFLGCAPREFLRAQRGLASSLTDAAANVQVARVPGG